MMRSFFWPEASFSSFFSCSESSLQIDLLQKLLHGLGAHAGLEIVLIFLAHIAVLFFGQDLVLGQWAVAGIGDDIVCKVQDFFVECGG